ncbi:MAG TPA: metalloregulator ArsR/SmtB family transcription factor [Rhizomicrobium sp.]|nr:metalloregulator ArsR/SmtB family transcription factor [Rhizomicrobium sp.]
MDRIVTMLRAAGDPTRLRLLLLLREAELTVSELTEIVGQSQPRVSRHLKLLSEARMIDRFKEGSWVFYRASDRGRPAQLGGALSELAAAQASAILQTDLHHLANVRQARAARAAAFFKANAAEWERIRALHAPDSDVEAAIVRLIAHTQGGHAPIHRFLDAGTGTGQMLELLAPYVTQGVGVDVSPEMLAIARERVAKFQHCQVRLADAYRLPFPNGTPLQGFDVVLFHQVLHFLDDPQAAVIDAARVLKPGGRVLIADFAPHELEYLRTDYAHRRLGFSDTEVQGWFEAAHLVSQASEAIAPTSGGELTVKIWLAQSTRARVKEAA